MRTVLLVLSIISLLLSVATSTLKAQSSGQVQLDILARDHYTRTSLDSVALAIYFDGIQLDSTVTGPDGRALMNFAVSLLEGPGELPTDFSLSYNYPNPFHSETRVDVGVPESQPVRMEIYNILGQRVATQSLQLDAGNYALNLSLGHLPVGVYFLRVAGRDAKVEKMIKMGRTFSSPGPVFRMAPMGLGSPGRPVTDQKAGSAYLLSSDGGYQLRAWRDRYQHFETNPEIEGNPAELLVEMRRNNIVTIATVDPDEGPVSREVRISGEQFTRTIATPDTLVLTSGIYTVVSTTDSLFAVNDVFEIVSRDSAYVIRPFVPQDAEISGRVANDQQVFVAGAQVKVYRDGSEYASTSTDPDGRFSTTLLADGGLYSLVIYPPAGNGVFDPETHSGFSPDARVITPQPGGSYELNFLLYTEPVLALPGGGTELPPGNYTLATDGGTVMVANIPPDLGIVGGTARAYSPTITPDAFPGEFATRQQGVESGLVSGGFASVNLLRSNGAGGVEPISELRDESGAPVPVTMRFRIDQMDYHVIRDPATLSQLPGFINRPDTIDVPLYYYDEELGDWLLTPQFGWLENEKGAIPMSDLTAIQEGTYDDVVYTAGVVDHFSVYNLDYPSRDACMRGRLVDQFGDPVPFGEVTFQSMPQGGLYSFFSNLIKATSDANGYFQISVPRTERGPGDDWNENNRVDNFRVTGRFDDKKACGVAIYDNNGRGYDTPDFPENSGCLNLGNLTAELKQAKKVNFEITFLDMEKDSLPDYPLFVNPPAVSGANYAVATLLDLRIPLMGPIWECTCATDSAVSACKPETTPNESGVAFFTIPVIDENAASPLIGSDYVHGTIAYRKTLPDLAIGAYEVANCNYEVSVKEKKETIRCDVSRRGPPLVSIIQPEPSRIDTLTIAGVDSIVKYYEYLYDDLLTFEASGTDLNGNVFDMSDAFFWTDTGFTTVISQGRVFQRSAMQIFGTGTDFSIQAHGIDFYGWIGSADTPDIDISTVSVTIQPDSAAMIPGDTLTARARVTGANNTDVLWNSQNNTVASVGQDGIITATGPGTASIIARSLADPTAIDSMFVSVENLVASFTVTPPAGEAHTEFSVDASSSAGNIVDYEWDFGDGNTASGQTTKHIYNETSVFTVTLSVTSSSGARAVSQRLVSTTGEPIALIAANPLAGNPPLEVHFDASGSFSPKGQIVSWDWDYGNGDVETGENVQYIFQAPGLFTVSLTVEDVDGQTATDSTQIRVNTPPVAGFQVTPNSGNVPLTVTVNAVASYDPDGSIEAYDWDFGDGTTIAGGNVVENHTYTSSGEFIVKLTVTDNDGASADTVQTVNTGCTEIHVGSINITDGASLQQLFGKCGITGDLFISSTQLDRLSGLESLQFINGLLNISNNGMMTSLNGLENLTSVGSLSISNNNELTDIRALMKLTSVENYLLLSSLPLLSDLNVFEGLERVGSVSIHNLPNLSIFNTFNKITSIDAIQITSVLSLMVFDGFSALKRVENNLLINSTGVSVCELISFRERIAAEGDGIGGTTMFSNNPQTRSGNILISSLSQMESMSGICMVNGNLTIGNYMQSDLAGLESLKMITGNLRIESIPSLTSLSGLEQLVEVMNDVTFSLNSGLTSMQGLNNLRHVKGSMSITGNQNLQSVTGLENLLRVDKWLTISHQPLMDDFQGLQGLFTVGETFFITDLTGLTSLTGLETLEYIGEKMIIRNLTNLQNFDHLNSLQSVRRGLELALLPNITDLSAFENIEMSSPTSDLSVNYLNGLTSLAGLHNTTQLRNVSVSNNPLLESFAGLNGLEEVHNEFTVNNNPAMSSLHGLNNLGRVGGRMQLMNLPQLSDLSGLESLRDIDRMLVINSIGTLSDLTSLQSVERIQEGIQLENIPGLINLNGLQNVDLNYINSSLTLKNMPDLQNLQGLGPVSEFYFLEIDNNPSLSSLSGLDFLETVPHGFTLRNNPNLASLEALSNLTEIEDGALILAGNHSVPNLSGMEKLSRIRRGLTIQNMNGLTNLEGLSGLQSVDGLIIENNENLASLSGPELLYEGFYLSVNNNPKLTNLSGLEHVTTLTELNINQNPALISLSGINEVTMISSNMNISGNQVLSSLSGLNKLTIVNGIYINDNSQLVSLDGLQNLVTVNFNLTISSNPQLERVTDMAALSRIGSSLSIQNNSALPTCDAENLRDQVLEKDGIGGSVTITGNDNSGVCDPGS
jgi:PKD repeat protein